MARSLQPVTLGVLLSAAILGTGCDRAPTASTEGEGQRHAVPAEGPGTPTNRVDIPAAVRQNLGITFVKVESRNVAQTLRVPGTFELLPTARREYRTPLPGRIELLVAQYQQVQAGTPLYRVDSAVWQDLLEQIAATQARVDSMTPLRSAHRVHERSLADKVELWQERLQQLAELRNAGGGSAAQFTEARATLNATQAELADVMEKDAELQAQQKQAEAELRSLNSRLELLSRSGACVHAPGVNQNTDPAAGYTVCAVSSGVVESLNVTPGGLAEDNALVVAVVQPEQIRFRARGLQSDLGILRPDLPVMITPPQGGSIPLQDTMSGVLQLGLTADPNERTIDLIAAPTSLRPWARAGVSAHLEIVLSGGDTSGNELAIPLSSVVRDGATPIIFRRDPANPDKAIRLDADLGRSDGRWVVIASGVKEGDEVVLGGNFQLMLATSGGTSKGGHFHPDGTFHEGED